MNLARTALIFHSGVTADASRYPLDPFVDRMPSTVSASHPLRISAALGRYGTRERQSNNSLTGEQVSASRKHNARHTPVCHTDTSANCMMHPGRLWREGRQSGNKSGLPPAGFVLWRNIPVFCRPPRPCDARSLLPIFRPHYRDSSCYLNKALRTAILDLPEERFAEDCNPGVGRPGKELWTNLVLAVLKQGPGCNFDRLHEHANTHVVLRQLFGHGQRPCGHRADERLSNQGSASRTSASLASA